ncbi:MAG: NAD(P)H-hydrate dehydratase [Clostridiaceae bacterium]
MIEVLSSNGCRAMDKEAIDKINIPSIVLMENAVFSLVKYFDELDQILIVCGTGNNGGDGLALARHLSLKGKMVKVFIIGSLDSASKDFNCNYTILKNIQVNITLINQGNCNNEFASDNSSVIVDCIFGTGLSRMLNQEFINVVNNINSACAYKISVDVPSGINCDTGEVLGAAVEADKTITFQVMKKGFFNYKALKYLGEVIVEPIGIPESVLNNVSENLRVLEKKDVLKNIPVRDIFGHKGTYGRVAVIAGSKEFSGAAYLTTEAAVKTGSGLVNLYTHKELQTVMNCKLSEAMVDSYENKENLREKLNKADAVAFGPGLGNSEKTFEMLKWVLSNFTGKIVIDADGINVLARDLGLLQGIRSEVVITPHPGEMARLTGKKIEEVNENRIQTATDFSQKYKVVVLLKGLSTIIADGNKVYINPSGNSSMASGGMGDTLTGIIASLMGQGLDAAEAAKTGAYIHGYIGEDLSMNMYSVNASEIIKNIPYYLRNITKA